MAHCAPLARSSQIEINSSIRQPGGQECDNDSKDITWNDITEAHWRHMANYISSATKRFPILKETEYDFLLNTPDAFTPDGRWILGEAPEIGNYFVCAGMNGNSLQGAGGVGKVVASWICEGCAPGNVLKFELQRFTSMHNTPRFLYERTFEVVGRHYQLQVSEHLQGDNVGLTVTLHEGPHYVCTGPEQSATVNPT